MKVFLPFFLFLFLLSSNLFSQNKIGQIAYAQWNVEEGKWTYYAFDNWTYDEEGREESFTHRDSRYSDYLPTNNTQSISKYNVAGRLEENNTLNYGPNQWENTLRQIKYNSDGDQQEELLTTTRSESEGELFYKNVFEKNDLENSNAIKFYQKNEAGQFILISQTDNLDNDENCSIENSIFNYNDDGSTKYGRLWKNKYIGNCQPKQSDFYRWNIVLDSMVHESQFVNEYFNDGKLMIITYRRLNSNTNQWELKQVTETEINDDGQTLRYFVESYRNNSIDSTLHLYTYTPQNEVETTHRFETVNTPNGKLYKSVRKDSFAYHYNLNDQIEIKEYFFQNYENPFDKRTTTYKYYCNGQLKSEMVASEVPHSRTDYRYFGGVDCPLEEGEKGMILFPNPTSGIFTIQANLLVHSETTIRVFTILGQEVFSKKIDQTSYQYQLDLSSLGSGHYVVSISNEGKSVSEKLVIF